MDGSARLRFDSAAWANHAAAPPRAQTLKQHAVTHSTLARRSKQAALAMHTYYHNRSYCRKFLQVPRYLGTPTFDGRLPILLTSSAVPEVPRYPYFRFQN